MNPTLHPAAIDMVKHFEGLFLKSYRCPAGVPTIGYGHTAGVKMGQTITLVQAEAFLAADLAAAAAEVDRLVTVTLTGQQRAALASFVFNLGAGNFAGSTLLKLLNKGDFEGAARQFGVWIKATVNGRKETLPGLVRRRKAEEQLFRARDWRAALDDGPMPQVVEQSAAMKPLQQSRSIKAAQVGGGVAAVTTAVSQIGPVVQQVRDMGEDIRAVVDGLPHPGWIVAGILAVALVYLVWRRIDDHRQQEA